MGLLQDIEAHAADRDRPLADLLRRCLILAYRLGHAPFRAWVERELNGYPQEAELPAYRYGLRGILKADLSGPMQSFVKNANVPVTSIPEPYRESIVRFDFRESVAELEDLVRASRAEGNGSVMRHVPVEVYANVTIYQGHSTMSLWAELSLAALVGVLDQVRNRALLFALEIEAENPAAGEAAPGSNPVAEARVAAIYHNVIAADIVNLAQGSSGIVQAGELSVVAGDLDGLLAFVRNLGLEESDVSQLREALAKDQAVAPGLGEQTRDWLGRTTVKVAASASRIGEAASAGLLASAVARYLGIH